MIKKNITVKKIGKLHYIMKNKKAQHFTPWLGSFVSFMYDGIMKKNTFPKKFDGCYDKHKSILNKLCKPIENKTVLDLAAGSGIISEFLPPNNSYYASDISEGLLRIAVRKFKSAGFTKADFYVSSAENLLFADNCFDYCFCFLAFNFFPDIKKAVSEIERVLKKNGTCIACIPLPERKKESVKIRGALLSEKELTELFSESGFLFTPLSEENGALLYFKAELKQ